MRTRLEGPAKTIAIAGIAMVVMLVLTIAITIWRVSASEDEWNHVAAQAETQHILNEMHATIVSRVQIANRALRTGRRDELPQLQQLEAKLDGLAAENRRARNVDEFVIEAQEMLIAANKAVGRAMTRALDLRGTAQAGSAARAFDESVERVEDILNDVSEDEAVETPKFISTGPARTPTRRASSCCSRASSGVSSSSGSSSS